ncbi:cytochrome c biogenesis protein CcmG, thiol:disulfide interchange protein DsbE [Halopseudomonas formosensis]|uniref:Cytochrome c biogenesis protein CcmG, thiol:disulfide interchange protein DsbE n=1 Tax=Halopseudomonas formosensis TaxID=1002526 RepID=A0A1I6BHM5_9GAMM|nr:DsbE family thiol:disulfide interchange protein [Halopseudomonas formosensis]SFQ80448.1 cytochrome c biogenesis protein CcmG, thiol:disulfide interchange protein DsbE [Halopseudomonas formosensis]
MRRPWMLIPLILFLGLAGLFLKTLYDKKNLQDLAIDPSALPSALIDKPVPAFALPSLDEPGRTLTEQDFRGEVALVNVWATWCPTCRAEHAMFNKLASQGVTIHGVNYKDNSEAARRWLEELGNPYQLNVEDPQGSLGINLGVYGAPETFLIDADGVIHYKYIGAVDERVWADQLGPRYQALLEQASGGQP